MEKIRIMEWNLNGKTGHMIKGKDIRRDYYFPWELIVKNIDRIKPDIMVFTEFCSYRFKENWDNKRSKKSTNNNDDALKLKDWLDKNKYDLFYSNFDIATDEEILKGQKFLWNGVGIAVKRKLNPTFCEENKDYRSEKDAEKNIPDHLIIKCKPDNGDEFIVVGVRIRPCGDDINKNQFKYLEKILKQYERYVAIGDFNNGAIKPNGKYKLEQYNYGYIQNECTKKLHAGLFTPGKKGENADKQVFSCTTKSYKTVNLSTIDHAITKFKNIDDVRYDWGFLEDVYTNLSKYTKNESLRTIPDHAILVLDILKDEKN